MIRRLFRRVGVFVTPPLLSFKFTYTCLDEFPFMFAYPWVQWNFDSSLVFLVLSSPLQKAPISFIVCFLFLGGLVQLWTLSVSLQPHSRGRLGLHDRTTASLWRPPPSFLYAVFTAQLVSLCEMEILLWSAPNIFLLNLCGLQFVCSGIRLLTVWLSQLRLRCSVEFVLYFILFVWN